MSFDVAGEAHDRRVGRRSRRLAPAFLDFAGGDPVRPPDTRRAGIREAVREIPGDPRGPFTLRSRALTVRGVR
jgi:hypothetical protein